ncbi:MAG: DUF2304 domain-containing protein [Lachnospiraceae bacterium]|nr:DUF2304 domain-containing protein [Lachnospiraceae bacterium]
MSMGLRVLLAVMSAWNFLYVVYKIRKSKLQIEYSVFWLFFSMVLILMSIFPKAVYWLTELVGIQSPVNLVFLAMIFVLIIRNFSVTLELSQTETKLKNLVQEVALMKTAEKAETMEGMIKEDEKE